MIDRSKYQLFEYYIIVDKTKSYSNLIRFKIKNVKQYKSTYIIGF